MSEKEWRASIDKKLDTLTQALVGNPSIGHRGIVPRLDLVETTVANISAERAAERSKRAGAIAVLMSLGAVAGTVGGLIAWIAQKIHINT